MGEGKRKLGIVFASGASNRICCLIIYGATALAMGYDVRVHLVNEGLVAFKKDVLPKLSTDDIDLTTFPQYFRPYVETYLRNLKESVSSGKVKDWYSWIKELKDLYRDSFKIYACPLAAQFYNIKKEDLADVVDDIKGAEAFLDEVYGGPILYIG